MDVEKVRKETIENLENLEKECSLLLERILVVKNAINHEKFETDEEIKEFLEVWSDYLTKGLKFIEL